MAVTAVFLATIIIALVFICLSNKLRYGLTLTFITLSFGVTTLLIIGFWSSVAFIYSVACLLSILGMLLGMSYWNFKNLQIAFIIIAITVLALLL